MILSNFRLAVVFMFFMSSMAVYAQIDAPLLIFNRGMLWHSLSYAKSGPGHNNWNQSGPALEWPGYDPSLVNQNIGGTAAHLSSGGFYIGAMRSGDTVLAVEDWALYGGSVSQDAAGKYLVTKHYKKKYSGELNHFNVYADGEGEEVVVTEWEYNPNYIQVNDYESQLPLRVRRTAHQWSGSKRDENYIIYEYVFKNIANEIKVSHPTRVISDTLFGFRAMLTYGIHNNARAWRVLNPQLSAGARNTKVNYDVATKTMYGESSNYGLSLVLGRVVNGQPQGEWLAPAMAGVKLLYSTPDTTKIATRVDINKVGWSRAENSQDLQGPFTGVPGTAQNYYEIIKDPAKAYRFIKWPFQLADSTFQNADRKWSLMSLGPWHLAPGDSVVIAIAEVVDGMDYSLALNKNLFPNQIFTESYTREFVPSLNRAQLTWDNKMKHPLAPASPKFEVGFGELAGTVTNLITWGDEKESVVDPHYGDRDLAAYKLYRSDFLPFGPWVLIDSIKVGDTKYYNSVTKKYTYIDSLVAIGTGYYYALTVIDTGRASWPINPAARFPETNSNRVVPMESSIFANRTQRPFIATIPSPATAEQVLVVPNPFVLGEGSGQPGAEDQIQFVNVPNPATIRIYTIRGDLVKTLDVTAGSGGVVTWDQATDYGQFVESGVYIFHVDSPTGTKVGKFAIVR